MLRFFVLISFLLSVQAYATDNGVEIDLNDLTLEEKVSSLQSKLRIANNQNKNLHAKILELEEKIREINGKMQNAEHLDDKFTNKIQNLAADTNHRFEVLEKKISAGIQNKSDLSSAISPQMVKYLNMIEKKNYKGAIQGLDQYINSNRTSPTLGEAYYWLGYAYMSNQEYTKAIKMFVNSYNGYPKGIKAEYSLLNMAVSLHRVKEYDKACNIIKKLATTSKNNQILHLAKYEENDFNCKIVPANTKSIKPTKLTKTKK